MIDFLFHNHDDDVDFSCLIIMFLRQPLSLIGLSLILISGCGQSSKTIEALQTKILEDVVSKGGSSLKAVMCPSDQPKAESLTCTGVLESGNGFDIAVKSQAGENHVWEIVSINGLLNMSQLQSAIQSGLTAELGNATIDCGTSTAYKATKPGEQFECQVTGTKPAADAKPSPDATASPTDKVEADAKKADAKQAPADPSKTKGQKPEKVVVTIAAGGNISWQRILPEGSATGDKQDSDAKVKDGGDQAKDPAKDGAKDGAIDPKTTANKSASKPTDATKPDAKNPDAAAAPAQSAEAALDAGGTDALED
jgi:hypothetical protein